eukprot:scaffold44388_cov63-Phaeocystis_antarctica.AAC.14
MRAWTSRLRRTVSNAFSSSPVPAVVMGSMLAAQGRPRARRRTGGWGGSSSGRSRMSRTKQGPVGARKRARGFFTARVSFTNALVADAPSSSSMARDRTNTDAMRYRTRSR